MPNQNLFIRINNQVVDIDADTAASIAISYKLEDPDNFQVKASADAEAISLPASKVNDLIFNTFHNPSIEDLTAGNIFGTFRTCGIEANGYEILNGKSLLVGASHTDKPTGYEINVYGNNADWMIALKDTTLFDFLKGLTIPYTTAQIMNSWTFDGTNAAMPYVFAPVRYMLPFDDVAFDARDTTQQKTNHYITNASYLCPSLSVYWIIYNAFQSIGYRLSSTFLDTDYFRRLVMPWTFGSFPSSNGTKQDVHKFLATTWNHNDVDNYIYENGKNDKWWNLNVVTPFTNPNDPVPVGTFDNNAVANGTPDYSYDPSTEKMTWEYNINESFGVQTVNLSLELLFSGHVTDNSDCTAAVYWYKNGSPVINTYTGLDNDSIMGANSSGSLGIFGAVGTLIGLTSNGGFAGDNTIFFTAIVQPGDVITARVYLHMYASKLGKCDCKAKISSFQFNYFSTPLNAGAVVDFNDYTFLKQYKFIDFLKGIIDLANMSIQADPVNRVVTLEPTHDYSLMHNQSVKSGGYITGNTLDWSQKQDLKKKSSLPLYSNGNREYIFRMADDGADGCLKVVSDRVQNAYQYKQDLITTSTNVWALTKSMLGASKYVLPDRFAKEVTQIQNSFFSPCMHYIETNWKGITGVAPQLICIIPENISNTSAAEAANTFAPKIAWYKGNVSGVGGWNFDPNPFSPVNTDTPNTNFIAYQTLPLMFAVNYNAGGENDPILSYSDELIGSVVGIGLMRRFYLQRMAIIRNGQWYDTFFKLNNSDAGNITHREHIVVAGQKWELIEVKDYKPMVDETTACNLRKWVPISQADNAAIYPTVGSINGQPNTTNVFETKYHPLMCLGSDIPQQ